MYLTVLGFGLSHLEYFYMFQGLFVFLVTARYSQIFN